MGGSEVRRRSINLPLWLGKVCIDQANLRHGLRVLAVNVMSCKHSPLWMHLARLQGLATLRSSPGSGKDQRPEGQVHTISPELRQPIVYGVLLSAIDGQPKCHVFFQSGDAGGRVQRRSAASAVLRWRRLRSVSQRRVEYYFSIRH